MAGKFLSNFFGISDEPTATEYYAEKSPATPVKPVVQPSNHKVVSIQQGLNREPGRIALFEPRIYSDVREIGKQLLNGQAVIVNFTQEDQKAALKTIDFLNGVVFAIDGKMKRIGEQIFLCTPKNYEVSGRTIDGHRDTPDL